MASASAEGSSLGQTTGGSSAGTTTSGDETTGDLPPGSFCEGLAADNLLACRDFDGGDQVGWDPYPAAGFMRTEDASSPPAHSPPNFAHIARQDTDGPLGPVQALFGSEFSLTEFAGASIGMEVRFPPDFEDRCGPDPIRLFEIRYGAEGAFTNVILEASLSEVLVYVVSDGTATVLTQTDVLSPPPQNGWYRLDLSLVVGDGAGGASFSMAGELVPPAMLPVTSFTPEGQLVSVNVGPWFEDGHAPPAGCNYDLDDLRLEGIPRMP